MLRSGLAMPHFEDYPKTKKPAFFSEKRGLIFNHSTAPSFIGCGLKVTLFKGACYLFDLII